MRWCYLWADCILVLVLTKQQQLWPAPSKSKEEVKCFSWLAGWRQDSLCSDPSFDQGDQQSGSILSRNRGLCILSVSLWWVCVSICCRCMLAWIWCRWESVALIRQCEKTWMTISLSSAAPWCNTVNMNVRAAEKVSLINVSGSN